MFSGFTPETGEFLMAISFNNNRAFFHENHDWYLRAVRGPMLELAAELAETIELIDPELERRPEKTVSRINRDIRFSKDKSPYRDYMWIGFHRLSNKGGTPGFYVDISAERMGYGMGFWEDNKPLMTAFRQRLLNKPGEFEAIAQKSLAGFGLDLNRYKRMSVPETLSGAAKAWYPARSFVAFGHIEDTKLICSPELTGFIRSEYKKLAPLYRYFAGLIPVETELS